MTSVDRRTVLAGLGSVAFVGGTLDRSVRPAPPNPDHLGRTTGRPWVGSGAGYGPRVPPGAVNVVELGAVGDLDPGDPTRATDNVVPIARAVAQVAAQGGGTLYFPAGRYLSSIDPSSRAVIEMVSHMTVLFGSEASLHWAPGYTGGHASLIRATEVSDVRVLGATLVGDRPNQDTDRQKHGIMFMGVQRAVVRGAHISQMDDAGDGIYVGRDGGTPSRRVLIEATTCEDVGRNGISLVHAHDVTIRGCTLVRCGLWGCDVENHGESDVIRDVRILDNRISGNRGPGLMLSGHGRTEGLIVAGNQFEGNSWRDHEHEYSAGLRCAQTGVAVHGNAFRGNGRNGIQTHQRDPSGLTMVGNTFIGGRRGIHEYGSYGIIVGNRFVAVEQAAVVAGGSPAPAGNIISDNAERS